MDMERNPLSAYLLFLALAAAPAAWAQSAPAPLVAPEVAEAIVEEGFERSRVMEHLDHLVNRIGQRLTSSDNLTNACHWAVERFQSFGIENARLERWGDFPVGFNRCQWSGFMVQPEEVALEFATEAWSAGTQGPVEAHAVLEPRNEEELEEAREQLAGAWVVSRQPARRGRQRSGGEMAERLAEAYRQAGIAGVVRPTGGIDPRYPTQVRAFGSFRIQWDNLPTEVTVHMRRDHHARIVEHLEAGSEVVLRFEIRNFFKQGPIDLYNVVADIPGTELPDEYVIVGGHIDSWHQATGTTDNGTGVATTLEAARILMAVGAEPRRTIRFMLWSGEEQGLLGSRAWVNRNRETLPRISAVYVHDQGTNYLAGVTCTPAMAEDMERIFTPVLDLDPEKPFRISVSERGLRGGGSDHASFLAAGVPGFAWQQRGSAVYGRTWHSQWDTFDAAVPGYQKHSSVVAALGALGTANLEHILSREGLRATGGRAADFASRLLGADLDGLRVRRVREGFAQTAGLQAGDVILRADGQELHNVRALFLALARDRGTVLKLVVRRGEEEVELEAVRPGIPEDPEGEEEEAEEAPRGRPRDR